MAAKRRRSDLSGRRKLSSPGRPPVATREDMARFWAAVSAKRSSEDASPTVLALRIRRGEAGWLAVFNFSAGADLPVPTRQGRPPALETDWDGRRLAPWGAAVWQGIDAEAGSVCG